MRDIAAGEELVWDYSLYDDDDPAPCYCGATHCRGTMYSAEWMAKLRLHQRAMLIEKQAGARTPVQRKRARKTRHRGGRRRPPARAKG